VPTQIVWASHDPATSREQAYVLFKTISEKQTATQMHVINRSGSFPFREQPEAFHHVISAFQEGVRVEIRDSYTSATCGVDIVREGISGDAGTCRGDPAKFSSATTLGRFLGRKNRTDKK
jgi:hypothetical protein